MNDMNFVDDFVDGKKGDEAAPESAAESANREDDLVDRIVAALMTVYDPEIPVNIYDLGLIYDVRVAEDGGATVVMTLTTPHCPVAESMPAHVESVVASVEGVGAVTVELVWDPPWGPDMMSEVARLELGFM